MTVARHPALVIGAGVVGLSTALYLQRAGRQVAVIDPLGPAGGASFGNAGMLSPDTATPIAMPGMLRRVPGWLRDPLGPLAVQAILFSARIAMAAAMGEGRPPRSRAGSVRRNAGVAPRNAGLLARTAR